MNDNDTDTFDKELEEALDEGKAFFKEIEESQPRAKIALACAFFEEWLDRELWKKFTDSLEQDYADLCHEEQTDLQNAVPPGGIGKGSTCLRVGNPSL